MTPLPGIRDTVLVAPGSFTGTFPAGEVAAAIANGLRDGGRPVDVCPAAHGGEGTLDALVAAMKGVVHTVEVSDPLGRAIEARFALSGSTAIVETAPVSGLAPVAAAGREAIEVSTFGTGELLVAAAAAGADTILLGVGGNATTDGGAGAIRAIARGGGLEGVRLVVLCDLRTAFAAGGLSGGLRAAFGADLVSGAAFVLDAIGFDARMRAARAVVTGEGRLDEQSLVGKVVSEVATRSRQAGVPCNAIVGTRELDAMGARVLDLERVLEATTLEELRDAGRRLAELL